MHNPSHGVGDAHTIWMNANWRRVQIQGVLIKFHTVVFKCVQQKTRNCTRLRYYHPLRASVIFSAVRMPKERLDRFLNASGFRDTLLIQTITMTTLAWHFFSRFAFLGDLTLAVNYSLYRRLQWEPLSPSVRRVSSNFKMGRKYTALWIHTFFFHKPLGHVVSTAVTGIREMGK